MCRESNDKPHIVAGLAPDSHSIHGVPQRWKPNGCRRGRRDQHAHDLASAAEVELLGFGREQALDCGRSRPSAPVDGVEPETETHHRRQEVARVVARPFEDSWVELEHELHVRRAREETLHAGHDRRLGALGVDLDQVGRRPVGPKNVSSDVASTSSGAAWSSQTAEIRGVNA